MKDVKSPISIKPGELIYEVSSSIEIKRIPGTKATENLTGKIIERDGEHLCISAAGGNSFWVKESSIIYPAVDK